MVYGLLLAFLAGFLVWAYKAMVDIRPEVQRPSLDAQAWQGIDELEPLLKAHIVILADEIGPRNIFIPDKLNAAADYIRTYWKKLGYEVRAQTFSVQNVACQNLAIEIPGKSKPEEIVLVGAHYDTVSWAPGANDNGSAVAALLELSRLFSTESPSRTLRFVAFTNEERRFSRLVPWAALFMRRRVRRKRKTLWGCCVLKPWVTTGMHPKRKDIPFPSVFSTRTKVTSLPLWATFAQSRWSSPLLGISWKRVTFRSNVWLPLASSQALTGLTTGLSGIAGIPPS
jgi:hypothetical protein